VKRLFEIPGIECEILQRINRFVVEIKIDAKTERAHVNNTGRLAEYLIEGNKAYCIQTRPRKTNYRVFAVEDRVYAALIDTQFQMRAFEKCLELGLIPWLNCVDFKRNQKLDDSLIDYLFFCPEPIYLEVKSAALRVGDLSLYPDCPSLRGRKHISKLIKLIKISKEYKAYILFIAAVPGVKAFKPNWEADPVIGNLLRRARKIGVRIKAINLFYRPSDNSVVLVNPDLPVFVDFE
jgi:sugar fermentation stimulation protein A